MSHTIDFEILELLASKICHDLISPIGAVNNGLEILEDVDPESLQDVTDLIAFSAGQASAKLQAYRMAYGAGGGDTSIKPEDVYKSIESMVGEEKKIRQDWDPHAKIGPEERPPGFAKMLISALLLAMECLPKGGIVSARTGTANEVIITAEGDNAGPREGMTEALSLTTPREKLEPKFVHAYMSGLNALHYGFKISLKQKSPNSVSFSLICPAA